MSRKTLQYFAAPISCGLFLIAVCLATGCTSGNGNPESETASGTSSSSGAEQTHTSAPKPEPVAEPVEEPPRLAHEDLDALLWVQTSSEYRALTQQTFRAARTAIGIALTTADWTASLEQLEMLTEDEIQEDWLNKLPPAVIMDVDETVLDNSAYQSGLIDEDAEYNREGWKEFVQSKVSIPVPGAVEFVDACRLAGVTVLFVTNREHEVEQATRENLINAGLMTEDDPDIVYTKYEKEEWTSDKSTRRSELAKEYRILMLVGDDLNDFVNPGYHASSDDRKMVAELHNQFFGERWFVLPNPNYGGWEQSIYDWENAVPADTKRERKREAMRR